MPRRKNPATVADIPLDPDALGPLAYEAQQLAELDLHVTLSHDVGKRKITAVEGDRKIVVDHTTNPLAAAEEALRKVLNGTS